jgi:hypothetical protein
MKVQKSILEIQDQLEFIFSTLENPQYSASLDAFSGSSIGKHVRHIFDFYACILHGCDCGQLDYNDRERNGLIEEDIIAAKVCFNQLADEIEKKDINLQIKVVTDFSCNNNEERPIVISSIGRELMYAFDHAIHHIAIIKMGIKSSFPEILIPAHVGVAPSTIKFHSKN